MEKKIDWLKKTIKMAIVEAIFLFAAILAMAVALTFLRK
jgi:hypothetical protein